MAEHLMVLLPRLALRTAVLALLQIAGASAFAEALADPTRPPAILTQDAHPDGKAPAPASGPVLQSILISPTRVVAIISGETVKQGDKYGDSRVVKISEGEVVLRSGSQLQTLKLFPDIEKLPASRHTGLNHDIQRKTNN
jgi:MSHA biogenesis protein MshK